MAISSSVLACVVEIHDGLKAPPGGRAIATSELDVHFASGGTLR